MVVFFFPRKFWGGGCWLDQRGRRLRLKTLRNPTTYRNIWTAICQMSRTKNDFILRRDSYLQPRADIWPGVKGGPYPLIENAVTWSAFVQALRRLNFRTEQLYIIMFFYPVSQKVKIRGALKTDLEEIKKLSAFLTYLL